MISLLYGVAIIALFWTPVGLLLHGYYVYRYSNYQDAEFNLDKDMRTWAPVVGLFLVIVLSETSLMWLAGVGACFEAYMTYSHEESTIDKFKRFLKDEEDN